MEKFKGMFSSYFFACRLLEGFDTNPRISWL